MNRQLLLILFIILQSITITLLPGYSSLTMVFASLVFTGIGAGGWDSAVIIWLVDMWPTDIINGPLIQVSQFMYGLGSIAAPIIAAPFVYGDGNDRTLLSSSSSSTIIITQQQSLTTQSQHKLEQLQRIKSLNIYIYIFIIYTTHKQ